MYIFLLLLYKCFASFDLSFITILIFRAYVVSHILLLHKNPNGINDKLKKKIAQCTDWLKIMVFVRRGINIFDLF